MVMRAPTGEAGHACFWICVARKNSLEFMLAMRGTYWVFMVPMGGKYRQALGLAPRIRKMAGTRATLLPGLAP